VPSKARSSSPIREPVDRLAVLVGPTDGITRFLAAIRPLIGEPMTWPFALALRRLLTIRGRAWTLSTAAGLIEMPFANAAISSVALTALLVAQPAAGIACFLIGMREAAAA
jgi:hypothetical protein